MRLEFRSIWKVNSSKKINRILPRHKWTEEGKIF